MQNTAKVKHIKFETLTKTRDEYSTRDHSIIVDTNKKTGSVTVEVTHFTPLADRVFDRLPEEKRLEWVEAFFNGENAPIIPSYTLVQKKH
jgi:hypothetical protein